MASRRSLAEQVEGKISRCWKRNVFTRKDFVALSDYDQIGRALLSLAREGKLIRLGYGLYTKARKNRITGLPMIAATGGFDQVAKEALNLLNVRWKSSTFEQAYNMGSTQIPLNSEVIVDGRFNRTIGTDKFKLLVRRN